MLHVKPIYYVYVLCKVGCGESTNGKETSSNKYHQPTDCSLFLSIVFAHKIET